MHDLPEYRTKKLAQLKEMGLQAWPERYSATHTLAEAALLPDGAPNISIAGRLVGLRRLGRLTFAHLQDIEGRLQIALKRDDLGESYGIFHSIIDIGDFIGVRGRIFTTKTGEKTLMVEDYQFLGKALRELPEKWHGLTDIELRYRQRYLDLVANEESRRVALLRPRMLKAIREFLDHRGFIEVETPILTNQASGALARPFLTHHNVLDIDLFLRIAPETYLKRLIVGGFTHVYEIARNFRNEGISPTHLQDFTMIEGYSAFWDYKDNMKLMRELILHVLHQLFGSAEIEMSGKKINFAREWPIVNFRDLLLKDADIDINLYRDAESLLKAIDEKGIQLEHENLERLGTGNLIDILYKKVSRPKLIEPTFLTEHPIDLSPLARRNNDDPHIADRFQLLVNGAEIINAYSELVDPLDQRQRLQAQAELRAGGDEEAMPLDHDYLLAMEHGMPPISGWGIGVDRLLQVLLDLPNIRDGVLFPLMRPLSQDI